MFGLLSRSVLINKNAKGTTAESKSPTGSLHGEVITSVGRDKEKIPTFGPDFNLDTVIVVILDISRN